MTKTQFRKALAELDLGVASQAASRALGLSVKQINKLANGGQEVSEPVARLLAMYLKHGIPKELRS